MIVTILPFNSNVILILCQIHESNHPYALIFIYYPFIQYHECILHLMDVKYQIIFSDVKCVK